tara:strand:- start:1793 stop:2524 length:732 start_codon:yes stop_codon:yes gene_type:complete
MSQISSDLLKKLKEVKNDLKISITSGEVIFAPLTLKQQKDLLSTAVSGIRGAIEFQKVLNNTIIENSDTDQIFTIDRAKICLLLRRQSLGDGVKAGEEILNINKFIDKVDKVKREFKMESKATEGGVTLSLKVPTLKEENAVISRCLVELDKAKDLNESSKAFGVIYLYELIKYIESVKVGEEVAVFTDLKIAERVEIIENLPLTVYKQLSTFFKAFTAYENEILTFEEKTIAIDPTFFDTAN